MAPAEGLVVHHSAIHGYGIVTARRFRKGEVVIHGDGVLYHQGEDFDDTYALVLPCVDGGPKFAAEAAADEDSVFFYDLVDQTRWINHSCEPNTEVKGEWDPAAGIVRTWWTAVRDLEIGEELTYDYAFIAEAAEPCSCGAAKCRGLIVDPDEIDDVAAELKPLLRVTPARRAQQA